MSTCPECGYWIKRKLFTSLGGKIVCNAFQCPEGHAWCVKYDCSMEALRVPLGGHIYDGEAVRKLCAGCPRRGKVRV